MRILVLSDSHGDMFSCKLAIEKHPEAEVLIHLGDGEDDIDMLDCIREKHVLRVRGNMFNPNSLTLHSGLLSVPPTLTQKIGGRVFYCSHGFLENVKFGPDKFIDRAEEEGAEIALYGHTHTQYKGFERNIHILNPGSIKRGEYALVDITGAGIVTLLMRLT